MKILQSFQIKEADKFTILNEPIPSINLMERAAGKISLWITKNISKKRNIKIFTGPGNNGGDGLAVARQIYEAGYKVEVYIVMITDKFSEDNKVNLERLKTIKKIPVFKIKKKEDFPGLENKDILVDALFGSGLTRSLEGIAKELVMFMNKSDLDIIAIDIPSGLYGENNSDNNKDAIIKARFTLSFQLPKLSFLFAGNEIYTGKWKILPIGLNKKFIEDMDSPYYFMDRKQVKGKLKTREKFSHKGNYGHVLLVSGGYGKMGAAILAAKACLKTGTGLLTVHVPKTGCQVMQVSVPEAMVSIDWSDFILTGIEEPGKYTNIGIGPGIGTKHNTGKALFSLLEKTNRPMVIDADALNLLSENLEYVNKIPGSSIITPHPKEFERLTGKKTGDYERLQLQIEFARKHNVIVVLKGAYTSIAMPGGKCYFNSTGNPGMATAGSGDVLTGIILSLLGQGYTPEDASLLGVYLHGLAGDIAAQKTGQEALTASDIIENLGKAYKRLKK